MLSSGDYNSNYFSYEVNGHENYVNHEEYKNMIVGKIENWIDEFQPSGLSTVWYALAGCTHMFILLIICALFVTLIVYSVDETKYFKQYENEVASILNEGINGANFERAIELLLVKQYGYVPDEWIVENTATYDKVILGCLIAFIACLFIKICPKSNFAIGKGKRRVKCWVQYRKIVFVVIPSMIIIPVIINLLT